MKKCIVFAVSVVVLSVAAAVDTPVVAPETTLTSGTWREEELEALCHAWRYCSEHSHQAAGANSDNLFWKAVLKRSQITRTVASLKSQWDNIRTQVTKLFAAVERVRADPQSGEVNHDETAMLRRAEQAYCQLRRASEVVAKTGKPPNVTKFPFWKCYYALRGMPRWQGGLVGHTSRARSSADSPSAASDAVTSPSSSSANAAAFSSSSSGGAATVSATGEAPPDPRNKRKADDYPRPDGGKKLQFQEKVAADNDRIRGQNECVCECACV
eukprot:GHVU01178210.1.p1 GENE.GHVU01178210.1~~GHVU01178210.1.p1  ORF type:complete len:270 (-),score=39.54 GHVU01178210.1:959-1768(-)